MTRSEINRILDGVGRFPEIEEDEPPRYLLVGDYRRLALPVAG